MIASETKERFEAIPVEKCLRLAEKEYDPNVNYAEVLASLIEQMSQHDGSSQRC